MKDTSMNRERRHFDGTQKLAILREHLLEKKPISEVCQRHNIQPTVFYQWQQKLFEQGAVVFDSKAAGGREQNAQAKRVEFLEAKVRNKDEVLAELMGEHVALKKNLGMI
jgi:transposase-like protein